jgi:hypothetical protein
MFAADRMLATLNIVRSRLSVVLSKLCARGTEKIGARGHFLEIIAALRDCKKGNVVST